MSEDNGIDMELLQLLLQHKACVDGVGDKANNVILVATRKSDLPVLRMLCDAGPRNEVLSEAVAVAFNKIHVVKYDVTLPSEVDTIPLLLEKATAELPIDQTLLNAVKLDHRLDIVRLLVAHGADPNYSNGASFAIALKTGNIKLLELLCTGCPPSQASIRSVLLTAIDPQYYNLQALELLLASTASTAIATDALWDTEQFKSNAERFRENPNLCTIVPCFLRHRIDVNFGGGALLCFAIGERDIALLERILSANSSVTSLRSAFRAATTVNPRNIQLDTMRLLLKKGGLNEIGQSPELYKRHILP